MDFGFVCAYELGSHSGQGRKEKETLFVHSEDHHRETMAEWKKGKKEKMSRTELMRRSKNLDKRLSLDFKGYNNPEEFFFWTILNAAGHGAHCCAIFWFRNWGRRVRPLSSSPDKASYP